MMQAPSTTARHLGLLAVLAALTLALSGCGIIERMTGAAARKEARAEEAKAKADEEARIKAEKDAQRKAEEEAAAKAADQKAKIEAELDQVRQQRAAEREKLAASRASASEDEEVPKTPAAVQKSMTDRIVESLDWIHKRV